MIFGFRFVCSQFHRGRVRITYDPLGDSTLNISSSAASQTACFNEVVDLTKDTYVEVRVPYTQGLAWLDCSDDAPFTFWQVNGAASFKQVGGKTNGSLVVRVQNALTAPTAVSDTYIIVSVRGADNLEFASPEDMSPRFSVFQPQSALEYDTKPRTEVVAGTRVGSTHPARFLCYMGEVVQSLRQIVHRESFSRIWITIATAGITSQWQIANRMPRWPGFDPAGIDLSVGLAVPGSYPYMYTALHPMSWIASAFVAYRGSVNWSMVPSSGAAANQVMKIGRSNLPPGEGVTTVLAAASAYNIKYNVSNTGKLYQANAAGVGVTHTTVNACLTVTSGFYSRYKFNSTNAKLLGSAAPADDSAQNTIMFNSYGSNGTTPQINLLAAAASVDWTPCFFLNVPTVYYYSAIGPPA